MLYWCIYIVPLVCLLSVLKCQLPTHRLSSRKDVEPDMLTCSNAVYFAVESLEDGEKKVRLAIDQGEAFNLGPYHFKVVWPSSE